MEYRGKSIEAETLADGTWAAIVDGEERGRPQRSKADALREARSSVNRSLGKPAVERSSTLIDPEAVEPEWVAELRERIKL